MLREQAHPCRQQATEKRRQSMCRQVFERVTIYMSVVNYK
jgi:hypothetical protein